MSDEDTAGSVAARARDHLATGALTDGLLPDKGRIGEPLPVLTPSGEVKSWAVPVLADSLIAGFFRTDPGLSDWRFSAFQRRAGSLDGCPPAILWLDIPDISRRAAALARPGERAADPVLSYAGVPDRLAWAVRLDAPDGTSRKVYVAGRAVWIESGSETPRYE